MNTSENNLVKKGLFALAAVGIVGATSSVYAAVGDGTDNSTSGYGTSSETSLAAIDRFNQDFNSLTSDFQSDVNGFIATAKAELQASGTADSADDFQGTFNAASGAYNAEVSDAANDFRTAIQSAASTAESKDQFIDRFNRAKAEYFNRLDAAKNQFAAQVSNFGDAANQTKDRFIGNYNSTRDAYGNDLEQIKNDFANTVSNA